MLCFGEGRAACTPAGLQAVGCCWGAFVRGTAAVQYAWPYVCSACTADHRPPCAGASCLPAMLQCHQTAGRPATGVKRGVQGLHDLSWQTYFLVIGQSWGLCPPQVAKRGESVVRGWMCRLRISARGDGCGKMHRAHHQGGVPLIGEVPIQGVLVEGQRRCGGGLHGVYGCAGGWVGVLLRWRMSPARHTCV